MGFEFPPLSCAELYFLYLTYHFFVNWIILEEGISSGWENMNITAWSIPDVNWLISPCALKLSPSVSTLQNQIFELSKTSFQSTDWSHFDFLYIIVHFSITNTFSAFFDSSTHPFLPKSQCLVHEGQVLKGDSRNIKAYKETKCNNSTTTDRNQYWTSTYWWV